MDSTGAHPTVAGNMLDPAVSADGMKGGRGVGGTAEPAVRDEGQEHIQKHGYGDEQDPSVAHAEGQGVGGLPSGQAYQSVGPQSGSRELGAGQQHREGIEYIRGAAGIHDTGSGVGSGLGSGVGSGVGSGYETGRTSTTDYTGSGAGTGAGYGSGAGGLGGLGS